MADRSVKILFDENFSAKHVEFIARESRLAHFQHIKTLGWSGLSDADWIVRAVEADFRIVTGDRNERTRGYTVADLKSLGSCVILLGSFFDHLDRWAKAKWLVNHVEQIVEKCGSLESGTVVLMGRNGHCTLL